MKKLLLFGLLNIGVYLSAQVSPIAEIEGGYSRYGVKLHKAITFKNNPPIVNKHGYYALLTFGGKWKGFKVLTNTYTYFQYSDISFAPWLATYEVKLSYTYKNLTVGYYHDCTHPIYSSKQIKYVYNASEDRVFIKWTIR